MKKMGKGAEGQVVPDRLRIAVVEDDERTRKLMTDWIGAQPGFVCVGAYGDGPAAVKALPAEMPDLVLMDINLPGFDGVECVRRLKEQMPAVQFVMLTVYEDSEHIFDALAAGAVGYLLKRSSPAELLEAIEEVRTGGSPMTSIIARKVVQSFMRPVPVQAVEVSQLSSREKEVLEFLARGFFYKEIADKLEISLNTVHTYIRRIYEKLHVRSRMEAVAKFRPQSNGC